MKATNTAAVCNESQTARETTKGIQSLIKYDKTQPEEAKVIQEGQRQQQIYSTRSTFWLKMFCKM